MIVTNFPRKVRVIEHMLIPLKDGTTLAARIWLPEDADRIRCLRSWSISPTESATGPMNGTR